MSGEKRLLLALDFGGTKISAATAYLGSTAWLAHERRLSPAHADANSDISTALELAEHVLDDRKPAAVGVSFGGPVWPDKGVVRLSHHVPGWESVPLAEALGDRFGAPVRIDNDAIVATLGEHKYGAGQGINDLVYITVSTGVGGGIMSEGRILRGADDIAGHVGHMRIEPKGPPCVCGSRGCLESIACGPAIAAEAVRRAQLEPVAGARLLEHAEGGADAVTAKDVFDLARGGDALCAAVVNRAAVALGIAIGNVANLVNPRRILVGGGVSKGGAILWDVMRQVARETAMPEVTLDLRPAALGDDAPLWGAVVLAEWVVPV
jgi:glucokinase